MVDFTRAYNPVGQNIGNTAGTLKHRAPRAINQPQVNGVALAIILIETLSSTSLRVTFNVPVRNNATLRDPLNYATSPVLSIYNVAPVAGPPDPTQIVLTTSEMVQGQVYTLTITLLEAA